MLPDNVIRMIWVESTDIKPDQSSKNATYDHVLVGTAYISVSINVQEH